MQGSPYVYEIYKTIDEPSGIRIFLIKVLTKFDHFGSETEHFKTLKISDFYI